MKKLIYVMLFVFLFSISVNVYADDYEICTLIPVNTQAVVNTDKFTYNFVYDMNFDLNGNNYINFASIRNNKISSSAVSINLLLFDGNQKNIGFVTYCSDKDINSDYSGAKIEGNQEIPFSIKVVKKYMVSGRELNEVKYVAVYDDNKYCHIGGYDKYNGLTIEEIKNGSIKTENNDSFLGKVLKNKELVKNILLIAIGFILYIVYGNILNYLYKRMYGKDTFFAYVPIVNFFISVKMVFGGIVYKIFIVLYFISLLLAFLKINVLFNILNILNVIVFVLIIIKIITKKYDLFYLEPKIKQKNSFNEVSSLDDNNSVHVSNTDLKNDVESPIDLNYETNNVVDEIVNISEVTNNSGIDNGIVDNNSDNNGLDNSEIEVKEDSKTNVALDDDELYDLDSYGDEEDDDDDESNEEKDVSDYFK